MLRFSRDESPPEKKSRIVDGAGAKAWLAAMAQPVSRDNLQEITEVLLALGALGVQDGTASLAPERKFAIAERIRGLLLQTLNERRGDRFGVLPHDDDFVDQFWALADAAVALRDVYAWLVSQLADAPVLSEPTVLPGGPTGGAAPPALVSGVGALHRALDLNAQLLTWVQRVRWPVPTTLWERHCVLGQLVRDLDCQDVEVVDVLRASVTRTCRAAFAMPVLVALADPAARSATELDVVRMAAQRWAAKVGFRLERRVEAQSDGRPAPARPVANPGPTVQLGTYLLRLDTQSALLSIDKRLEALGDGQTPREVGIGDGLRPEAARDLLLSLKQRWGAVLPAEIDSPDRAWRPAAAGLQVVAMVGLPGAGGKRRDGDPGGPATGRPGHSTYAYRRSAHDGITRPREAIETDRLEQLLVDAETWTLDAESSDAVRCVRRYSRPRLGLQRLIGLRLGTPGKAAPFLIGWIEALQCGRVGADPASRHGTAQTVRVRLAPGLPQLLHASIDDAEVDGVFLLAPRAALAADGRPPARSPVFVPMLSQPGLDVAAMAPRDADGWDPVRASPRDYGLILPHASFRLHRLVKAGRHGVVASLRLEELMMRGADFDLVRFTVL